MDVFDTKLDADNPRIGIVLSSGGVRGVYAHTGFLQAIEALNLPIAAMAGCSAGAVVGGVVASGTPLKRWSKALEIMKQKDFWSPDSLPGLIWKMIRHQGRGFSGLSHTDTALNFCRKHLSAEIFEQCQYPFYALAINLGTGQKAIFSEGELAPRLVASAATPVLYRPMKIEGEYYCDGAVVEFAPTDAICCRHHLDVVIVHHVSQHFDHQRDMDEVLKRPWSLMEVVERLLYRNRPWYLSDEHLTFQRCPCGCGAVVIAVEPSLQELHWPLTEGGMQSLIDARDQAKSLLSPYKEALKKDPRRNLPLQSTSCGETVASKGGIRSDH